MISTLKKFWHSFSLILICLYYYILRNSTTSSFVWRVWRFIFCDSLSFSNHFFHITLSHTRNVLKWLLICIHLSLLLVGESQNSSNFEHEWKNYLGDFRSDFKYVVCKNTHYENFFLLSHICNIGSVSTSQIIKRIGSESTYVYLYLI